MNPLFRVLGAVLPHAKAAPIIQPGRIVLILPCCIGDVVLATATLKALRRAYPTAHITWAVGTWSRPAIENHDLLDALLDTGPDALPVKSLAGFQRFVGQLRAGNFDLAVSLVRSPLMSAAVWLSGIPHRVGLDSAGRGFGYNLRVPVNPESPQHEARIYLETVRALGHTTANSFANVPVHAQDAASIQALRRENALTGPYLVLNPAGGNNPGMVMDSKRWPPQNFAQLGDRLAQKLNADGLILIGGPKDAPLLDQVAAQLQTRHLSLPGRLSFGQIAALAKQAKLYIGNDTGLTHLAAAAGAKTVMILGPSDPRRYAPFGPQSLALWKPIPLKSGGVAAGPPPDWHWERDGLSVQDAEAQILAFLEKQPEELPS